jgi:hypothetical protein
LARDLNCARAVALEKCGLKERAAVMSLQLDLFHNADPLIGTQMTLSRHCQCGHDTFCVGPGYGAHRASLRCVRCGHQRGCLSNENAKFPSDVIEHFDSPIAPVRVRMQRTTPNLRPLDTVKGSTVPHIRAEELPGNAGTSVEDTDE